MVAAPALAAVPMCGELPAYGGTERIANLAAPAFGGARAATRLTVRRRRRDLAERAAAARHPLPAGPLTRGVLPLVVGSVLCAVAAGAVAVGLRGVHDDERHAERGGCVTARLTGRDEESVRVRTDDGRPAVYPPYIPRTTAPVPP